MGFVPNSSRYSGMPYRRCGKSGLLLPALSLGLWHNFGHVDKRSNYEALLFRAFDLGITHFDLANNYGPPPGSAETNFGHLLNTELKSYRDELVISTKAGYIMWEGPYGDWGSKKYLVASLDQSLKRMGLEYVDIFYHHRPDPHTPLQETMGALDMLVRQGKALYAGISNYPVDLAKEAVLMLKDMGTPCLIHQPKYSMFSREPEQGLLDMLSANGAGCIAFSPLAQGLLTDKYIKGIPEESRATKAKFLKPEHIDETKLNVIRQLNDIALERGDTLAQMAINWLLKDDRVTSVLIGASSVRQIEEAVEGLSRPLLSEAELQKIEVVLQSASIDCTWW